MVQIFNLTTPARNLLSEGYAIQYEDGRTAAHLPTRPQKPLRRHTLRPSILTNLVNFLPNECDGLRVFAALRTTCTIWSAKWIPSTKC